VDWLKKNWFVVVIILGIVVLAVIASLYQQNKLLKEREERATYERQLKGELSAKEQQLEATNIELKLVKAKLVDQRTLNDEYEQEAIDHDREFEKFKKEHDLVVDSMSHTIHQLTIHSNGGSTTVCICPTCPGATGPTTQPASSLPYTISYEYTSPYSRVHLVDPDINTPGNEELTTSQNFQVRGEIFRQKDGNLKVQRVQLDEVVAKDGGGWETLGTATLVDDPGSSFTYVNPPKLEPEQRAGWDFAIMATVATAVSDSPALAFGASLGIARYHAWGIAAGFTSDFSTTANSGGNLALTYRPNISGRDANIVFGAGGVLHLDGNLAPALNVNFVVW
jgi:hypothetical protein